MSSAQGTRPSGTDGSDHWHRESVAWQYKISSINKSRLRIDMLVHILLAMLMLTRLLPGILTFWGTKQPWFLQRWNLPPPRPWEYGWFVSIISVLFGWKSVAKNTTVLLNQYIIGTVVFGLLPVLYGLVEQFDDLMDYLNNKKVVLHMYVYPAVIVWYFFLIVTLQMHLFGLYFAVRLRNAWGKVARDKPKMH